MLVRDEGVGGDGDVLFGAVDDPLGLPGLLVVVVGLVLVDVVRSLRFRSVEDPDPVEATQMSQDVPDYPPYGLSFPTSYASTLSLRSITRTLFSDTIRLLYFCFYLYSYSSLTDSSPSVTLRSPPRPRLRDFFLLRPVQCHYFN